MSNSRPVRLDIQALRAIAVMMVVTFHLWPNRLPGGFAGVDVFFVISGFLISSALFGELADAGKVQLAKFWARRIRRLLPAALLVIAITAAVSLLVVPTFTRRSFFAEAIASTFYFENWQLAASATNYFAGESSPFQHYWSLAVEEQFYIVWPLALTAISLFAKRRTIRFLPGILAAFVVASFAYSLYLSYAQPDLAYFSTFARVWEFGIGASLALLGHRVKLTSVGQACLSLGGAAAIGFASLILNENIAFPGWAALLPTLGTAAVILAGMHAIPTWLDRLYGLKPIRFTGEISYSLYLWHWPLIILLPWATGYQPRAIELIFVLIATFVVAWASKKFVEDRFRAMPALTSRRPRFTYFLAALASTAILVLSLIGTGITANQMANASGQTQTLDRAKNDTADPDHKCMTEAEATDVKICKYGRLGADYRVLLVGDSHAAMHLGAWKQLAEAGGFELNLAYKASCSFNLERRSDSARGQTCQQWNLNLQKRLAVEKPYNLVLASHYTAVRATQIEGQSKAATVAGFKAAWAPLQKRGSTVVAIRDGVNMDAQMRHCWETSVYDASKCSMAEKDAFIEDLAQRAASSPPGALTMDFTDLYCQNGECPAMVDGVYVYRDNSHISLLFSQNMAGDWYRRLVELGVALPKISGLEN
jgi:peptidoglycan/LPS O-acetylase OafA/YrhL